jgi:hypothetical protein
VLPDRCGRFLSGQCDAFGVHDAIFCAARGRRIAQVSARDFLRSIAGSIENAHAHKEAVLAGHSRYLTR